MAPADQARADHQDPHDRHVTPSPSRSRPDCRDAGHRNGGEPTGCLWWTIGRSGTLATVKIVKIETIVPEGGANLIFVAVHTDEGLVGYGDTYYAPEAVRGYIHGFAAPMLLGQDPLAIELHWRRLYERIAHIVGKGAEIRGLSAIDVALWDIFGQSVGLPVWQLLGGAARDRVKTYNTCGGPGYGRPGKSWQKISESGQYEDLVGFMTDAGALAEDLLSEGYGGMKIWPFDPVAIRPGAWKDWQEIMSWVGGERPRLGGQEITLTDLNDALEPVRRIRDAVGDRMEIMIEGHGYWSLPAAKRIAGGLEEFRPAWLEDLMRADDVSALAALQASTTIPVLVSEYLTTRYEYKPVLEQGASDHIMIDPTWAGGITESKKISTLAEAYRRPVSYHDCTGPFTLYAGVHLAINATNAVYQESLRSYLRVTYPTFVTEVPTVEQGHILAPTSPGIGSALLPDVRSRGDVSVVESTV
jgi:L-alanine-DL-glutamate epimerase-like enolase superfamily enzyme